MNKQQYGAAVGSQNDFNVPLCNCRAWAPDVSRMIIINAPSPLKFFNVFILSLFGPFVTLNFFGILRLVSTILWFRWWNWRSDKLRFTTLLADRLQRHLLVNFVIKFGILYDSKFTCFQSRKQRTVQFYRFPFFFISFFICARHFWDTI